MTGTLAPVMSAEHVDEPSTVEPTTRNRRRIRVWLLFVIWAVSALFYFWTATSTGNPVVLNHRPNDYYNQLTDGFLKGELSVPTPPPAGLLRLADPYDPNLNQRFRAQHGGIGDLSLYHGRLYLSWGPTPVVTLYLPWRALGVGDIPQNFAGFIFGVVGIGFALAFYELLITRYLSAASLVRVGFGGLALVTSNVVPYLLRRAAVYEVACACSYCFVAMGLFFLARGTLFGRFRPISCAVGSACIALSAGARFETLIFAPAIALIAVWVYRQSNEVPSRLRLRRAAVIAVPWSVIVLMILVYNYARFHDPTQVGTAYVLAGYDATKTPWNQIAYLLPSLYYYVFAPVRFVLTFPFVALPPPPLYPGTVPEAYRPEIIGGLLTTTPILFVLFGATFILRDRLAQLGRIVAVLSAVSIVLIVLIAFTVAGGTMRYETDFAPLLLVGTLMTWLAWNPARRWPRRLVTGAGAALILVGVFVGLSISISGPYGNQMRIANPTRYASLADALAFIPRIATQLEGGPRIARITDGIVDYPANLGFDGTYNTGTRRFTLTQDPEEIDIAVPHAGTYALNSQIALTANAPKGGVIEVVLVNNSTTLTSPLLTHFAANPSLGDIPGSPVAGPRPLNAIVQLSAGVNYIYLWARTSQPQPPHSPPGIINVYGLSIQPAPTGSTITP